MAIAGGPQRGSAPLFRNRLPTLGAQIEAISLFSWDNEPHQEQENKAFSDLIEAFQGKRRMRSAIWVGQHCFLMLFILLSCWGIAQPLMKSVVLPGQRLLHGALSLCVGLGVSVCALQAVALAGMLTRNIVLALLAVGCAFALPSQIRFMRSLSHALRTAPETPRQDNGYSLTVLQRLLIVWLFISCLPTLLQALYPPTSWDSCMYHLPHAVQWASSGRLSINEWIRYPWFPYNFDLLFAAVLLWNQELLTQLLSAAAGWISAILLFALVRRSLGNWSALLSVAFWLRLAHHDQVMAGNDTGVALFLNACATALVLWCESSPQEFTAKTRNALLFVAAFMLGLAVGSKYQALFWLPIFAAIVLWRGRPWRGSWHTLMTAIAILAVPCIYWYARNAWLTGDPFDPLGGPIFGFFDWNSDDLKHQFADLRANRNLPPWFVWPALAAPLFPALRAQPLVRHGFIWSAWGTVVWAISSGYPRYLLPTYAPLCMLSASCVVHVLRTCGNTFVKYIRRPALFSGLAKCLLAVVLIVSSAQSFKRSLLISDSLPLDSGMQRDTYLSRKMPGYALMRQLPQLLPGRIYQISNEDMVYYSAEPIWGEVFGPWRYGDFVGASTEHLVSRLRSEGFAGLLVNSDRAAHVISRPGFDQDFFLLAADGPLRLYRLNN